MDARHTPQSEYLYRRRFLGSLVVVLLLGIALVRWWPAPLNSSSEAPFRDRAPERIQLEEVQPTSQAKELKPPPPAPLPPVVVPNDVLIKEELEFGDAKLAVEDPEDDAEYQEGAADASTASRQPDTNARLFRAVQPEYPSAAQEKSVRARVQVTVHVTDQGQVQEASVQKRWLLSTDGHAQPVARLEYGLEEAALSAARRSLFRPARADGDPVETQTTLTFEFGTSED